MTSVAERVRSIGATLTVARLGEKIAALPSGIQLAVLDGPDKGVHEVVGEEVNVGRGKLCGVRLTDPSISEFHFKLSLGDGEILLDDLESHNGIWIGRAQIRRAALLPGAVFRAGACRFRLEDIATTPRAVTDHEEFHGLWGRSAAMRSAFALLARAAPTPIPVLVTGETGCGKGMVARAIHECSGRRGRFVTLDCTSLPRDMAEALVLGHVKGAFTGAIANRSSPFEEADGGTLFLDEIGELPFELQAKLLRVVDEQVVQRVGAHDSRRVDVRLVAATNRDIAREIAAGRFRADLYHRIACVSVRIPPLRARPDDIGLLAEVFLREVAKEIGTDLAFDDEALTALSKGEWPGNVRELLQAVRRTAYLAEDSLICASDLILTKEDGEVDHLRESVVRDPGGLPPLEEILDRSRRDYCAAILDRAGNIAEAAEISGYTTRGLRSLLKRLGIPIPDHFRRMNGRS